MEIGKNEVIKIFKANFNYEIVETKLGYGIKMPAQEAFIFCNVTGAGYLDNPVYPFTPKGLHKLFYNAFDYKFVTGIFENSRLNHTPYLLSKAKQFIFSQEKIIIPVEFESEIELGTLLENFFSNENDCCNFIILRIEKRKKGNGMEAFMEYLVTSHFKNLGYIVENQIPLAYSLGSPDFGGYKLKETFDAINQTSIFNSKGFHLIELSMLRLGFEKRNIKNEDLNFAIVGEAKTGTTKMKEQLCKYLDSGLFEFGFEIHPSKKSPEIDSFGLFTIDETTYKFSFQPPNKPYVSEKLAYSKTDYYDWLNNYIKFHLIANFTNDELIDYYKLITKKVNFNQGELVDFVCSLKTIDIIKKIIELK